MKWTNGMIKQIAMQQSALDANLLVNADAIPFLRYSGST